jgi:hypothetical protein
MQLQEDAQAGTQRYVYPHEKISALRQQADDRLCKVATAIAQTVSGQSIWDFLHELVDSRSKEVVQVRKRPKNT